MLGAPARIRVVIADDSLIVREGLAQVLAGHVEVVAVCEDLPGLLAAVARDRPDVVVTDIRMPPTLTDEGVRAAAALRASRPEVGVVVLSQYSEGGYALALFASGSAGRAYLLKDRVGDRRALLDAIEAVAHGGSRVDPLVVDAMLSVQQRHGRSRLGQLSPRELEVLGLIAQGHSNAGISELLVLEKRTVEKHVSAVFAKLGLVDTPDVSRRVSATLIFLAEAGDAPPAPEA